MAKSSKTDSLAGLKVDSNIPVPAVRRNWKEVAAALKPGDSVQLTKAEAKALLVHQKTNGLISRKLGEDKYRIWKA